MQSPQILGLKIKNFMSIADVEIKPKQINIIAGQNNQGKTTLLKAIGWGAKGAVDPSLIKHGEDAAEVIIELPDETTARRRINASGKQTLEVKKGEFKAPSPQTFLEGLFDFNAFNPIELLDPKKRSDNILKSIDLKVTKEQLAEKLGVKSDELPPIDFNQHGLKVIDDAYKFYYARRVEANRDTVEKKNRFETYQKDFKPAEQPAHTRDELKKSREAINLEKGTANATVIEVQVKNENTSKAIKDRDETLLKYNKAIDDLKFDADKIIADMARLQAEHDKIQARIADGNKLIDELKAKEIAPLLSDADAQAVIKKCDESLAAIDVQEKEHDAFDAVSKQKAMIDDCENQFKAAQAVADALDLKVATLSGKLKAELMAGAEMPIKGLEYVDGVFLVDKTPVDNLSSSLAMKLAIGVARKLSKRTKVICVDGLEMLDDAALADFLKEITADGFTYFISNVGERNFGDAQVIIMENGTVKQ